MRLFLVTLLLVFTSTAAAQTNASSRSAETFFDAEYSRDYEDAMVDRMNRGIGRFLDRYNDHVADRRPNHWSRDLSSPSAYARSVSPNRAALRRIIGVVDERVSPVELEYYGADPSQGSLVAETERYTVHQVRWPVLENIHGEGLLLTPTSPISARVVAVPDADHTPEQLVGLTSGVASASQYARRLAESGVQVLVPTLVNRESTYSGNPAMVSRKPWQDPDPVRLQTNQPHREWIYRQAYVMGRHVIGFEVQKILAAVDWFEDQPGDAPTGVAGYGEGGLLALYAGAVDPRIDASLVSGYFGPREDLWQEPLYRNVWGLLEQFGDAEIASLTAPRALVIEHSEVPDVDGPPPTEHARPASPAGRLETPSLNAVRQEVARLRGFFERGSVAPDVELIHGDGALETVSFGSSPALRAFSQRLDTQLSQAGAPPADARSTIDPDQRQKRQVQEMTDYLHDMVQVADGARYAFLQGDRSSPAAWDASMETHRDYLYEEMIGRIPRELLPPNPQRRKIYDEDNWTGYEVVLDVWPDVFAWGILAVPDDMQPGEKRPVVVMQHGVGGTPTTPIRVDSYNRVLPELVDRGFIVFSPRNPYRFNVRKATPLKTSVYSVLVPQHQQIVRWLSSLDYVDEDRIGFYGKSWGGRSALRIPALIDDYALSICSAYFNQWPRKAMTAEYAITYMKTSSIGIYEFNQGLTFGHAELASLIAPRPFMVESGYQDGVAPHEWVGYEFAKVQRLYDLMGIGDRAALGFFDGGHEIDAATTFPFLHKHLDWPAPDQQAAR